MKRAKCDSNELTIPPKWKALKLVDEGRANSSPTQKCGEGCPDVELPTCGSDGIKYGNPCELKIAACKYPELNIVENSGEACVRSKVRRYCEVM
ncbi:protease inhibitor Epi2 [Phytophthora megakarya]|uniref:Protease inhibitor Epi2 n=1 Tax=Phytophthora megakarya TaxID=4795 RepID=A0A225UK72_9STRA|nr:protease inhibitor Epi2 [Phytophthora megakarya]